MKFTLHIVALLILLTTNSLKGMAAENPAQNYEVSFTQHKSTFSSRPWTHDKEPTDKRIKLQLSISFALQHFEALARQEKEYPQMPFINILDFKIYTKKDGVKELKVSCPGLSKQGCISIIKKTLEDLKKSNMPQ